MTVTSDGRQKHRPLFDVHPVTGASIEVFYADGLATFGRGGVGWFWWRRRRGFAPDRPAVGPFPTSYSAYRAAFLAGALCVWSVSTYVSTIALVSQSSHDPAPTELFEK
jgi:hypothetical protein